MQSFRGGGLAGSLCWNHTHQSRKLSPAFVIRALIHGALVWRRLKKKSPNVGEISLSLCTQTCGPRIRICLYESKKERGERGGNLHCLVIYVFIHAKANLYPTSGTESVYISGITPTFYIPGAQPSLGLLVIPVTANGSCTRPPRREHLSTHRCRLPFASRKLIFYSREKELGTAPLYRSSRRRAWCIACCLAMLLGDTAPATKILHLLVVAGRVGSTWRFAHPERCGKRCLLRSGSVCRDVSSAALAALMSCITMRCALQ